MQGYIELIINQVNKILDMGDKDKQKESEIFVQEMYEMTEKIYNDFSETLWTAYNSVINDQMTIDEAVYFLNDKRLPFKSVRAKVRGFMHHPYYYKDEHKIWFALGVIGVLEGGLHGFTEMALRSKIREEDILNSQIYLKGNHTIVDIIARYDNESRYSFFSSEVYKYLFNSDNVDVIIKKSLLRDIKLQINSIDESWQRVCNNYPYLIKKK